MTHIWRHAGRTATNALRKNRMGIAKDNTNSCRFWRFLPQRTAHFTSVHGRSQESIVRSPFPDMDQPHGNIVDLVFKHAHKWGSNTAFECSETGQTYTYNQLQEAISKFAGFLKSRLGLSKGDVMAIHMPNCIENTIAMLGALSQGIVATIVNSTYTADELAKQLKVSTSKVLVSKSVLEPTVLSCLKLLEKPLPVVMLGPSKIPDTYDYEGILKDAAIPYADAVHVDFKDLCLLPYSGGTTGPPKCVASSHGAYTANVLACTHPDIYPGQFASGSFQNTFMGLLPFYHIGGILIINMLGLHTGAKVVTVPSFNPKLFLNLMKKHKFDILHLVPPLLNFLAKSPQADPSDLSSVRSIIVGAAPVSPSSAKTFKAKFGQHISFQEGYGMTETLITNTVPFRKQRIGSCGQLLPNVTAKIIDTATGEDLMPNQTGELCVKSPSMMIGYYQNEAATNATIDKEGWLHTGDVGHFNDEGFLKIVDRTKELIKVKALQVSPSELEDILRRQPDVLDVGVVGVPHDRFGEAPKAFIVSKGGITEEDIHRYMEDKVAPHKRLAGGVVFVKELPKTPTGKLLKRMLN